MTEPGRSAKLSLYHRNLTLGVMQVMALLQLVLELDGAPRSPICTGGPSSR